jgi:hypothetical protein
MIPQGSVTAMKEIPSIFEDKVLHFPECSYGVTKTVVILANERGIRDVFIAWDKEIARVGETKDVPFNPTTNVNISYQK